MGAHKRQTAPPFLGHFDVTITEDGRLRLPKGVIQLLQAHQVRSLRLCALPWLKALVMCPTALWDAWIQEAKHRFLCLSTPVGIRTCLSPSTVVQPDARGRISIPERLCEHAGLRVGDTAVVVGMEHYLEIWSPGELEQALLAGETAVRQGLNNPSLLAIPRRMAALWSLAAEPPALAQKVPT